MPLTQDRLKEVLDYNPGTGVFTWKTAPRYGINAGDRAGSLDGAGYVQIKVDRKLHRAHRLAWLYVYGKFPSAMDHKNRVKSDNRIENLREASDFQNLANQPAKRNGLKGAYWHKLAQKWWSQITVDYKYIYLGLFETEPEAHLAYCAAARKHRGEYACFA